MKNLRASTIRAALIISFVAVFLLVGCGDKEKGSEKLEGLKENEMTDEVFTCSDVGLSALAELPLNPVQLSAVPSVFGEYLALKVTAVDGEGSLNVPVLRSADGRGGAMFNVPPHPNGSMQGGEVTLEFTDGNEQPCEPFTFTILPLPHSPGAYAELVALLDAVNKELARVWGSASGQQGIIPAVGTSPMDAPTIIVDDLIRGGDNPNSLEEIAKGNAPAVEGMSEDEEELTDGLVRQSGILDELEQMLDELKGTEPMPSDPATSDPMPSDGKKGTDGSDESFQSGDSGGPNDSGSDSSNDPANAEEGNDTNESDDNEEDNLNHCNHPFYMPDAPTLSAMMNLQVRSDIYGNETGLLDASDLLWNGAAVLATGAGAQPLSKGFASISGAIGTFKTMTGAMQGILPDELVSVTFDYDAKSFLEDDEKLDGEWSNARLVARNSGWSGDQVLLGTLFNAAAGSITKGWLEHFNVSGSAGGDAIEMLSGKLSGLASGHTFKDIDKIKKRGLLDIPSCDFGPTDITEEPWSIVKIRDEAEAPAYIVDRYNYQVRGTGEALLVIEPNEKMFGRRSFNKSGQFIYAEEVISIPPIEVVVAPSDFRGDPGSTAVFVATVNNANDKSIAWNVSPEGGHRISVETRSDGTSVLTVVTSNDDADYPATVTATSTSNKGLRSLPDALPREGYALIRGNKASIDISPGTCCLELGDTETFTAVVHGFDNQKVTWSASEGKITSAGIYTAPEEAALVTITATSLADPTVTGEALITVGDCICWSGIDIEGKKLVYDTTTITRAGNDWTGPITDMMFLFDGNGDRDGEDSLRISLLDEGPMPGQTGSYKAELEGSFFESGMASFVARQYSIEMFGQGIPWEVLSNNNEIYVLDVPHHVTLNIEEFIEGPEPFMAKVRGSISGDALVLQNEAGVPLYMDSNQTYRISIRLNFQAYYDYKLTSIGEINCYGEGW